MTSPTSPGSVSDDLRVVAPAFTDLRALAAAPVSVATWRGISQLVVGSVVLLIAAIGLAVALSVSLSLVAVLIGIPMFVATLWAGRPFAQLERTRLQAQLAVEISAPTYPRRDGVWASWWAILSDSRTWAHSAYVVVAGLLLTVQSVVVTVAGGFALAAWSTRWSPRRTGSPIHPSRWSSWSRRRSPAPGSRLWPPRPGPSRSCAPAGPCWAPPHGPRRSRRRGRRRPAASQAEGRAVQLTETRTAAVGAADDERRRIERDLHDGAQQRLVALGVELGIGRAHGRERPRGRRARSTHAHARGQGDARRAARPRPRHPPGGAHRPRPRRRAVRAGRPLPGPGRASTCPTRRR